MNKKYLSYLLKKESLFYIVLFLVYFVSFPILTLFISESNKDMLLQMSYVSVIVLFVVGYILPILDFRHNYIKSMANYYYSLPITSRAIYQTKTYFNIIANVLVFSLNILIGIAILAIKQIDLYYEYLFLYLLCVDVIFISLFLFQSFIASRTYNLTDSIILSLLYLILPAFLLISLYFGLGLDDTFINWTQISFMGSVDLVIKHFISRSFNNFGTEFANYSSLILMLIAVLILHIITLYKVKRLKIELVGERSTSIFGYKLLLPLYLFLFLLLGNYTTGWLCLLLNVVIIITAIMYSIWRYHKIQFNWHFILFYLVSFGITSLIAFLV